MRRFKRHCGMATALSTVMVMNALGAVMPITAAPLSTEEMARTAAKFKFGLTPQDGYMQVTSGQIYDETLGYGFSTQEYPSVAPGWVSSVYYPRVVTKTPANAKYIKDDIGSIKFSSKVWTETESTGYGVYTYENTSTFDVDLQSKDYTVIVELTNPTNEAISVYVEAEDITKVTGVEVKPGETKTCRFVSCLVDGQLNLKFLAASNTTTETAALEKGVYVSKVEIEQVTKVEGEKPTVFIASDSTVQTYESNYYPQTGWGQVLYNFFKGGNQVDERECENCDYSQAQTYETESVVIENRAIGGRSSKSFIEEGKIDDLLEDVKPGDFLLVQWGHNDATTSRPNRYVSTADFEKYIQYYIDGAKQRGATCVLVTPVARRSYTTATDGSISFKSDFEGYRQVMLKMAKDQNVPVLDLTQASIDVCNKFGSEGSKSLFLWLNAGDYPDSAYAGGVSDSTHLQYYGAYKFAQCVGELIQSYSQDNQLDGLKQLVEMPVNFTDVPGIPTGLQTTTVGASSVSLKWNKQDDAELYYIYRAELIEGQSIEDIVFTPENKYSVSATPKYTDGACEGGKTYVYAIAGFNEIGVGSLSDKITVTTKSAAYRYDFSSAATDPVMQGWNGVHSKQEYTTEAGYGWSKAPGGGRYRKDNGNADSNDMTDDFCLGAGEFIVDLPNGEYEVKITACDLLPGTSTIKPGYTAEGLSIGGISTKQAAGTLSASVKVTDGQLNIGVGGTNPYINGLEITPVRLSPTGFVYQELSFSGEQANFLLNWDDVSDAISYNVYRKTSSDSKFTLHQTITQAEKSSATTLPFAGDLGETVAYYVTAVFEDGAETPPSKTIEIELIDKNGVLPVAPTGLTCVSADNNKVQLEWNAVDQAIKYMVYRSDREEGEKGYKGYQKVAEVREAIFTDESVSTNINWYYKVVAVNSAGPGEASAATKTPITTTLVRQPAEVLSDRALVAINLGADAGIGTNVDENGKEGTKISVANEGVYLSWRLFEKDPKDVTFTLYKNGQLLTDNLTVTNYLDVEGTANDAYEVVGSSDAALGLNSKVVATWQNQYIEFQLDKPEDQKMPDDTICTYTANDMSVADLDGDGQYELIVKWYPSNAKDNSGSGYTGTTILDAYDIDINTGSATRMWRIDLGVNIRSGAHYTQFQSWDLDGDGKAEIACKTADGTVDGRGNVIGDASADYRSTSGYVLEGPEYFTVFNGETGEVLDTVDYIPERGKVSAWGDAYGNRVDRFLSCIAYLDGETPSFVAGRGYYTRTCLTAYTFKNGKIETTWTFDTDVAGKEYEAQGNHGVAVADIDGDGKDEIIYGALVVDHDGTVKYSTGLGHGDAQHTSDWVPSNAGLEIMSVHEHTNAEYQVEIRDAETGEILTGFFTGKDTGRGMAADIDPTHEGGEFWSSIEWDGSMGGLYASTSTVDELVKISDTTPSVNFSLYWDGDLLAEMQNHTFNNKNGNYYPISTNITKWDYENNENVTLFESSEILTSNGTKGNVGLVADVMGDWRDEIIARTSDVANDKVRIYSTTIETDYALPTFMEDHEYRTGIAWQNVGYNQPAHTSYLISEGINVPEITVQEEKKDTITLSWTEASDGIYGHDVTGYKVYRYNEVEQTYEVIGETATDNRTFTDTNIAPNTIYSYKVAALVNNRDSFRSQAVEAKSSLSIKSVPTLAAIELVQGDEKFTDFLPNTVTVINQDDEAVEDISITWDLEAFDINGLGEMIIYGTINGYSELVPLSINIVTNDVVEIEELLTVYTIINVEPTLPLTVKHMMKDGTVKELAVTWDTSALDYTKVDTYVIKGKTELVDEISLTVSVRENYITSVEPVRMVEVFEGEEAKLPTHVMATYADNTSKEEAVTWETVDTSNIGVVTVKGTIEGYAQNVIIQVSVIKKPLYRFDFGINAASVNQGWTGVTVNAKSGTDIQLGAYNTELGYGFADINSTNLTRAIEGRSEGYTYEGTIPEDVYTDFVLPGGKQFIVDLPNGSYTVQVVGGSFYKSSVRGSVEGQTISIDNAAGTYQIQTISDVVVTDGQMTFDFNNATTSRMNAIVIIENPEVALDTVAPELSYDGLTTLEVVHGEDFTVPEVKAIDEVDGAVTVEVMIKAPSGEAIESIDTIVAGTYTITYVAVDAAGNKAEMTITVAVLEKEVVEPTPDTQKPVFIYEGEQSIEVAYGEGFTMPEVTALDDVDGELTAVAVITTASGEVIESIDTTVSGTYTITYTATDAAGNTTQMTITVQVSVAKEPLYRFDFGINADYILDGWTGVTVNPKGGTNITLGAYREDLGYGFTKSDGTVLTSGIQGRQEDYTYEGILDKLVYTDFVLPDGTQFIVNVPNGKYTVQIVGGSYNKSTVKGYVEGQRINVGNAAKEYAIQTIQGVEVTDDKMNFTFDTGATSRMNAIIIIPEEVVEVDTEKPVFSYEGAPSIEVVFGQEFIMPEVKAIDKVDGDVAVEAEITTASGEVIESIDTTVAGTYTITYTAADEAGNKAEMTITVIVLEEEEVVEPTPDTEKPAFNYEGSQSIQVAYGQGFTMPEVKAIDKVDGDVEVEVTITTASGEEIESIDTTVVGTYTITYTAADEAGNKAEMTITVIVLEEEEVVEPTPDTEKPAFNYEGSQSIQVAYGQGFTMPEVKAVDKVDGEVVVKVTITTASGEVRESIDTTVAGTYRITYTATDVAGNTNQLIMTVTVNKKVVEESDDDDDDNTTPSTPSESQGGGNIVLPSVEEVIGNALKEGANPLVEVDKNGKLNILKDIVKQIVESGKVLEVKVSESISIRMNAQTLKEQEDSGITIKAVKPDVKEIEKINTVIKGDQMLEVIGGDKFIIAVEVTGKDKFVEPAMIKFDLSKEKINKGAVLVAVRYELQKDGSMKAVKIGGIYDEKTEEFQFLIDQTGLFGLVEAEKMTQINLVVNDRVSVVNGNSILNDVAPIITNDRVMLPVRFIAESLGAKVGYKKGKVTITLDDQTIEFKVNENLEGYDVEPFIQDSRTYISARWVAEAFGANVLWVPSSSSVQIVK